MENFFMIRSQNKLHFPRPVQPNQVVKIVVAYCTYAEVHMCSVYSSAYTLFIQLSGSFTPAEKQPQKIHNKMQTNILCLKDLQTNETKNWERKIET
jgi:hypothetical protein